ncbi:MAG: hypothetical protein LKH04_08920 [Lachnospiraceae bacterium]|nr:hypothetical protein [Lachnospiraceae bacterium]
MRKWKSAPALAAVTPSRYVQGNRLCADGQAGVAKYSLEMGTSIPSILFCVDDLEEAHRQFVQKHVETTDLIDMGGMQTFSFRDNEGNYYAVKS